MHPFPLCATYPTDCVLPFLQDRELHELRKPPLMTLHYVRMLDQGVRGGVHAIHGCCLQRFHRS